MDREVGVRLRVVSQVPPPYGSPYRAPYCSLAHRPPVPLPPPTAPRAVGSADPLLQVTSRLKKALLIAINNRLCWLSTTDCVEESIVDSRRGA